MELYASKRISYDKPKTVEAPKYRILLIDDDVSMLSLISKFYTSRGYDCVTFESIESAMAELNKNPDYDLIVTDLNFPQGSGLDLVSYVQTKKIDIPMILITAYDSIDTAVKSLQMNVYDYIAKPLNLLELEVLSKRAIRLHYLEQEHKALVEKVKSFEDPLQLIGCSQQIKDLNILVNKVAKVVSNVLITGESGTGKEVVARLLHELSDRKDKKFIAINCAAIPSELLEAELFGYKKGAFTGAIENKMGLFGEANGGTLFLDEIGDMPVALQAKVLRVIQERKVKVIGENELQDIDVRIIAATHKNLYEAISRKEFREDLFYRLCVFPIKMPALRERREDIPLLAEYFVKKYASKNKKTIHGLSAGALVKLKNYYWKGNVRELENTIERAAVFATGGLIDENDITISENHAFYSEFTKTFRELPSLKDVERQYITYVLETTKMKKEEAANILGINRKTLYRKQKEFNIA